LFIVSFICSFQALAITRKEQVRKGGLPPLLLCLLGFEIYFVTS
jgi:hypothetical protein